MQTRSQKRCKEIRAAAAAVAERDRVREDEPAAEEKEADSAPSSPPREVNYAPSADEARIQTTKALQLILDG